MKNEMVHIGMKELMETIENATAYPPVVDTGFAFSTECSFKYQRLEWPQMVKAHGQLIMANGQKVRIQMAKPIDVKAMRQVRRTSSRNDLIKNARKIGIELVEEVERREEFGTTWATIDEMTKMVHQANVRPAAEIPADEIVVEDDVIIDLDSGVSSSHTTPAPTPDVILMPTRPQAQVPVPSARAPSPVTTDPTMVSMLKQVLEGQDKLQKDMESKLNKQNLSIAKLETMYETTTRDMATLKLEMRVNQVKLIMII